MPIYSYHCSGCDKRFDKLFPTISKAEKYQDKIKCECGKTAKRAWENPPKFFMKFADAPVYSDSSDPNR